MDLKNHVKITLKRVKMTYKRKCKKFYLLRELPFLFFPFFVFAFFPFLVFLKHHSFSPPITVEY